MTNTTAKQEINLEVLLIALQRLNGTPQHKCGFSEDESVTSSYVHELSGEVKFETCTIFSDDDERHALIGISNGEQVDSIIDMPLQIIFKNLEDIAAMQNVLEAAKTTFINAALHR